MAIRSLQGQLLVASPLLLDPNFNRTVVLLLAHSEEGALGLILNRPSTTDLEASLPQWRSMASEPPVVFVGGPVSDGAICLALVGEREPPVGYTPLHGSERPGARLDGWSSHVGTIDLGADPEAVAASVERLRVYAGYAGWAAEQLEREIDAGAWWIVEPDADDIFAPEPLDLWVRVLRRQGGDLALVAAYPDDPALN
jgi:putative transcriptional regulator